MNNYVANINRRDFLKMGISASAGLSLAVCVPTGCSKDSNLAKNGFSPSVWILINRNNEIELVISRSEMGQGVTTALAMLLAEELDIEWEKIKTIQAEAHSIYGSQYTGGSMSIRHLWKPLRKAGATGRQLLITAAAKIWKVDESTCRTHLGAVIHENGNSLRYGELVEVAAQLPIPDNIKLKDKKDFILLGKPIPRLDTPKKITGEAKFGMDITLPNLKVATVLHSPVFGGRVSKFDREAGLKVKGVEHIFEINSGIAIVAQNFWQTQKAIKEINAIWDSGGNSENSNDRIFDKYRNLITSKGEIAYTKGNSATQLDDGDKKVSFDYETSFQAHATMEPMNCVAHVHDNGCDIWAPTQNPQGARDAAAKVLYSSVENLMQKVESKLVGRPYANIRVFPTQIGGGFGRRLKLDFITEAVLISKKIAAPIKLIWSREEDIQHDFYRPATLNKLTLILDSNGKIKEWQHRIVGPEKSPSIRGAFPLHYSIPNILIDYHVQKIGVPIGAWRGVGHSLNAFMIECVVDEIAIMNKIDPIEYRKSMMSHLPRHTAVLNLARQKSGWAQPLMEGHFQGVALHECFGSIIAQIAEISINADKKIKVHKVTCAIDCGFVVNPEIVKSQMESGIIFGLTATIKGQITITNGKVNQSNFHDFPLLTFSEMPVIEVYIIDSNEEPGGVGEAGVPPIAPAIANAYFAASGERKRRLPLV